MALNIEYFVNAIFSELDDTDLSMVLYFFHHTFVCEVSKLP